MLLLTHDAWVEPVPHPLHERITSLTTIARTPPQVLSRVDPPAERLGLLSFLLACAVVFHQQQLDDWAVPSSGLLVTLAAVWLLLRPTSTRRLALMIGLHAVSVVADLPEAVNHWLLLFLAEVGAVVAIATGALRRQPWVRDPGQVYLRIAPYLRVQFLFVYLAAAFAKINTDFLNPDLSCGVVMTDRLLTLGPVDLTADWLSYPAIWGTIVLELLLPLGLAWKRTRIAALLVGIGFHISLALIGHMPFSGFALAYYALFAPDDLLLRAREVLARHDRLARNLARVRTSAASPMGTVTALAVALAVTAAFQVPALHRLLSLGFFVLFLLFTAVFTGALVACLLVRQPLTWLPSPLRLASPVWVVGPLLVALNATSPYIGGKTQSTFTMYSNLQTEGTSWNHALIPQSVQVLGTQDHLVRIVGSSEAHMVEAAQTDRLWVWDGLRSWAHRHPDASLVYEVDGRRFTVPRVGDDQRLRMSSLSTKLAHYRDVPLGTQNYCRTLRVDAGQQQS